MRQPPQLRIPLLDVKPVVIASLKPGSLFRTIGERGLEGPLRIAARLDSSVASIDLEGDRPFSLNLMRYPGASALVYPVAAMWASIEQGEFLENDGAFWKEGTLGFDDEKAYLLATSFGPGSQTAKHWISLTSWERVSTPDFSGFAPVWQLRATGMDGAELELASTAAEQIASQARR